MEVIIINLADILKQLKVKVKEIGNYQLDSLKKKLDVSKKSTNIDLVSEVDRYSEEKIIEWIKNNFPEHNILAEESGIIDNQSQYQWVIDPLDGTTNYVHGFPIFSISIALIKDTDPILGLIYVPYLDELYSAVKGEGAYLNGEKIMVSDKKELTESLLVTGFPYDLTEDKYNNIDIFSSLIFKTRGIRRIGSAAYDLACVAAGSLDGFWELKLSPWDVKAGIVIIREAGGKVIETDLAGHYLILAGPQEIVDNLYKEIKTVYQK